MTIPTFFQTPEWMSLWVKHFGKESIQIDANYFLKEGDGFSLAPTSFVLNHQQVADFADFVGGEEIIRKVIQEVNPIEINFLREDSQNLAILKEMGAKVEDQDVSPYIVLPTSFDEYLAKLSRKDRHEINRKLRRFSASGATFERFDGSEAQVARFFELMEFDEEKKEFLTAPMKEFFKDILMTLYPLKKASILFIKHEAKLVAGIILFYFNDEVLLYNSGFDPEYFYLSPGVVVVSQAIKDSIEKEKKVFDFLRGNERYKYDLGGADRKLLRVTLNRV
jgi:CelD/BcsL family acetyltransferase involved in cellulose biosynthesis